MSKLKRMTSANGEVYFVDANSGERVEVDPAFTNSKDKKYEMHFGTLLTLGRFISFIGWVLFVIAIVAILVGVVGVISDERDFRRFGPLALISGLVSIIFGIIVVAIGQTMSCFVSIERNTFETKQLLKVLIKESENDTNLISK